MSNYSKQTNWGQFTPLVTVFFFWGFVAASNDILIPVFQKAFHLSQTESMLVQICFYIAYTVGSLIYMAVSKGLKQDLINKIGYKNGLILGLLISAAGTLLFYPAANMKSFILMILALFIVGLGFSLQQIVANPLAIEIGPSETGSQRLTMAGGINNLGTTIGPLIISFAIFGSSSESNMEGNIESVKIPYLFLGAAFILVALMLKFSSLPAVTPTNIENTDDATSGKHRKSAFQYPQLVLGMIAIFVYVGVEVSTASNLPAYMEKGLGFKTKDIAPYISLYWASLMIGRWTGAVDAFDFGAGIKKILRFLAPYLAFGVFLLVNAIAKHDLSHFYVYALIIIVMVICDIMSKGNPARMLLIFSLAGITALLIGMLTSGMVSVYAFTSVGLFCSTLWPCIFALAINGLGKHTNEGSGFLIMMIMGGGIVSFIQGYIADLTNIHFSYIVGVICFAYLAFYAIRVSSILKSQGIDLNKITKSGGGH
ncbi:MULTISPECIES: MFS transporter [Chryseobacterium]|uniref:L-fucose-proton symporter n=2 Tax=Chryseobacterium TaxID=59732 RepID=A0A6N4X9L3_9FLAO|nr:MULTISPECIES: MFS transporter [Chryseobacterium]RMZ60500.1 MFS transporter [Chryseobacterium nematophagum]CAA7195693.1 L-fucose-proton symporter [Chryseobacterium potabilaquae]